MSYSFYINLLSEIKFPLFILHISAPNGKLCGQKLLRQLAASKPLKHPSSAFRWSKDVRWRLKADARQSNNNLKKKKSLFLQRYTGWLNSKSTLTVQHLEWKMPELKMSALHSIFWGTIPWVPVARMSFIQVTYYLAEQSLCFLRKSFLALTLRIGKTLLIHRFVIKLLNH